MIEFSLLFWFLQVGMGFWFVSMSAAEGAGL